MSKGLSAAPVLHIADGAVSCEFYQKLGFSIEGMHQFEPNSPQFIFLRSGGARLFLTEHHIDGSNQAEVYVYVDDIDAWHAAAATNGLTLPPPTHEPWGCCEITVQDPDGH